MKRNYLLLHSTMCRVGEVNQPDVDTLGEGLRVWERRRAHPVVRALPPPHPALGAVVAGDRPLPGAVGGGGPCPGGAGGGEAVCRGVAGAGCEATRLGAEQLKTSSGEAVPGGGWL